MWQWLGSNWHKIGLIALAITHFWDKFEKMFNFITKLFPTKNPEGQKEVKPIKMSKRNKLKLIQELIEAAHLEGYDEGVFDTTIHGNPNKKSLKHNSDYVDIVLKRVRKEFDI